jgi:hypothetical protein
LYCELLILWSRSLLKELMGTQIVKKFSAFYRSWMFFTMFTTAHHWTLPWISFLCKLYWKWVK